MKNTLSSFAGPWRVAGLLIIAAAVSGCGTTPMVYEGRYEGQLRPGKISPDQTNAYEIALVLQPAGDGAIIARENDQPFDVLPVTWVSTNDQLRIQVDGEAPWTLEARDDKLMPVDAAGDKVSPLLLKRVP